MREAQSAAHIEIECHEEGEALIGKESRAPLARP
jgi:hypothetical protein